MGIIKFSIIIPVYNAEKHLKKCFNSLFTQTFLDIEFIAINDGSTDLSLPLLNELAESEPRLKVFSQLNFGPSTARNLGLENAIGEYISFVDADDWLEENAFEHLNEQIMNNYCPDIVMFNAYKNNVTKNKAFLKTRIYLKQDIKKYVYPRLIESLDKSKGSAIRASVCLRMFKKNLIQDKIRFNANLRNNEDLVFCFEATISAQSFLYLGDSYLYHNNMTEGTLSRGYVNEAFVMMKPLFEILNKISRKAINYNFSNQIKARVFRTLIFCIENEFREKNNKSFFKKYKDIKKMMYDEEIKTYLNNYCPGKEKSKILYFYLYKSKMIFLTMVFANYKLKKTAKI